MDLFLLDRNFAVQSVQSGYPLQATATQSVNTSIIFLLIMAILTAIVGSIGLTGTMSINVLERNREIGVMMTSGAVNVVIIEGLIIGLIARILAIGLSFPISSLPLAVIREVMMGPAITLSFTPLGILFSPGVVLLSVFSSILPARNTTRLMINEPLAYE